MNIIYVDGQRINEFEDRAEYLEFIVSPDYEEPFVGVYPNEETGGEVVKYNKQAEADREREIAKYTPLTFEVVSAGTIYWGGHKYRN